MKARVLDNNNYRLTQGYNANSHRALDMVKYYSSTCNITAHTEGTVVWLQTGQGHNPGSTGNKSYGNCVKIKHPNGYYTLYAHLKSVNVKLGQWVKKGQKIGYMGNTGNSYGAHLHWEVRNAKDTRINPTPYINADLPATQNTYQAYDNVKNEWLPRVKFGTDDYAGNFGNGISGIKITKLKYRAHDKVKKQWLPWVTGDLDYAGNLPNDIDGIQVKNAKYRVHIKGQGWLGWVNKVDNTPEGYAGIYGKSIDAVQIK